jgi:hypothetical protein
LSQAAEDLRAVLRIVRVGARVRVDQSMFQGAIDEDGELAGGGRDGLGLPGVCGRLLIRSQSPGGSRKFIAPIKAQPATSNIGADIILRFVEQHRDAVVRVHALDEGETARAIMTSPFIRVVAYSVLDGWRLVVAHDQRHFEQARRVTLSPGFPRS